MARGGARVSVLRPRSSSSLIVFCVLWNAFFVSAEYAFVSVRHTRLDELVAEGNRRARTVRKIVADPSRFISAFQLGITLSSLALGALGEPAVARVLDSALRPVSIWAVGASSSVVARASSSSRSCTS